jgi:DNA-binding CsgD family transcriptional regulator
VFMRCNPPRLVLESPISMAERSELRGRDTESEALEAHLAAARRGESRALVLRGEAGIGKTALILDMIRKAEGLQLLQAAGTESEQELAFAALQRFCQPVAEGLDCLPAPQQRALTVAFGAGVGAPPERLVVGLAVLGLLAEAAEAQPLLCAVDDAQWLDTATAEVLAFVGRRLHAEGIALVFATREADQRFEGLPEIVLGGLAPKPARELLDSGLPWIQDSAVKERYIAEARGNPLALLELARDPSSAWLTGPLTPSSPNASSVSSRVEKSFQRRAQQLPSDARRLMLIAAAEPLGDATLLWDAAERCGIGPDAGIAAEASGMIGLGGHVIFRHPLVRSAVYAIADAAERRQAHQALADVTDADSDPDRRAWHRAQAAIAPSEDIANELEASASRARARGGVSAAAAFAARAASLTRDRGRRAYRAVEAAEMALNAGAPAEVSELLSLADSTSLDPHGRARVELLRARSAFAVSRGRGDAPSLLRAAKRLEPLDLPLARRTYLDAFMAGIYAGRLGEIAVDVARAALQAPQPAGPRIPTDDLLDGLALMVAESYAQGVPLLKTALRRAREEKFEGDALHPLFIVAANTTWDYESWVLLCDRQVNFARRTGTLSALPFALSTRMGAHLVSGEFAEATSIWREITLLTDAMGILPTAQWDAFLAAWSEDENTALDVMERTTSRMTAIGEGLGMTVVDWATAARYNGMCRYQDALTAAESAYAQSAELRGPEWIHEIVEAAARSDHQDRARELVREVADMTTACGTDWALGVQAYCYALVSDDATAEAYCRTAIERFEQGRLGILLARAHLVFGEWLRRRARPSDARRELRAAHASFEEMGLNSFAWRAARELAATGARLRKRSASDEDDLTPQEAQVAALACDGHSNRIIGEQLFISPRTVEYHLHKVFSKLDITSRTQLHAALDRLLTQKKKP